MTSTARIEVVDTASLPHERVQIEVIRPLWRRIHWGLLLALAVGAVLRSAWLDYARPTPVSDFKHYLDAALALLDTGVFGVGDPSAWRLPAYPAVLAVAALARRDVLFLSGVTAAISVLQVGLTYGLALRIFRRRWAASVSGLTAAVAPAFVTFAPVLASEHLLAVCVLAALGVALEVRRRGWVRPLLAGALLGAGVLTRGEALAYLPAVVVVVAAGRWRARRRVPHALGAALLTVAGLALVVGPWIVRNERVVGAGAGLSTTGGFNFYLAHSPGPYGWRTPLPAPLQITDEVRRNRAGWEHGLRYVREHPADWWPTARRGTAELLGPSRYAARYATVTVDPVARNLVARDDLALRADAVDLAARSSHWLLWAGAAGFALVPVWRLRAWFAVAGIVAANWLTYAVIFWAQARYRFVVDALACVAVGAVPAAVAAVASWIRQRRRGPDR